MFAVIRLTASSAINLAHHDFLVDVGAENSSARTKPGLAGGPAILFPGGESRRDKTFTLQNNLPGVCPRCTVRGKQTPSPGDMAFGGGESRARFNSYVASFKLISCKAAEGPNTTLKKELV